MRELITMFIVGMILIGLALNTAYNQGVLLRTEVMKRVFSYDQE